MQPSLTFEAFASLAADHSVVPLSVEVLADRVTPVSVFDSLTEDGDGFLLESVEGGERWARWSFVGWDPQFTLTAHDGVAETDSGVDLANGDPLTVLEDLTERFSVPDGDELGFGGPVPPLHSGAVGYLSYDAVRYVERLPNRPNDDRGLPEMLWQFVGGLAAIDRLRETVTLIRNVYVTDDLEADYEQAVDLLRDAV
ncbi:MAG: anthranilate synthase component I, partial [Acidimicrobiia bacterium]